MPARTETPGGARGSTVSLPKILFRLPAARHLPFDRSVYILDFPAYCSHFLRNLKKMCDSVINEQKRLLLRVFYRVPRDSKLFIVLLASVVMLPSLSIDSCLAS